MLLGNQVTGAQHEDRLCCVVGLEMDLLGRLSVVEPWMVQHLLRRRSAVPVLVKARSEEATGFGAQVTDLLRRQVDVVLLKQSFHIREIFSIEGHAPAEQHVDDYCGAPDVDFAIVRPLHQDLRSDVARAAQSLRQEALVLRDCLGEAEVRQFDYASLFIYEDVVKFDVSVRNVHPVQVID